MIEARILPRLDDVLELREEWDELYRRARPPHLFLAPAWIMNWWAAFGPASPEVRTVSVRRDGRLVGLAPFRVAPERHWGATHRTLRPWADLNSNRTGLLVDPEVAPEVLESLVGTLADDASWTLAAIHPVPLDSEATKAWIGALRRQAFKVGLEPGFTSPYMTLPTGPASPFDTVSPSFRRNLKRKLNRAEREGCRVVHPPAAEAAEMAFAVSRESWQHANGTGLHTTTDNSAFFRGMVADPWLRERLRIPILVRGDVPLAYEWNFAEGPRLFNLKVGYRPEAASLSPGLVLRHHTVAGAMESGLEEFDFLGSVERYKMHWATATRRHGTLFVFRGGLRAAAIHGALYRARPALKRSRLAVRVVRALRGASEPGSSDA